MSNPPENAAGWITTRQAKWSKSGGGNVPVSLEKVEQGSAPWMYVFFFFFWHFVFNHPLTRPLAQQWNAAGTMLSTTDDEGIVRIYKRTFSRFRLESTAIKKN